MLILIKGPWIVHEILVAIHALFLITGPGIDHGLVCQHGTPFVWNVKNISVTLLTLFVFEVGIGVLPVFFVIIFIDEKMNDQVLEAVKGLGKKEFIGVLRCR